MAEYLLKGGKMLSKPCPTCGSPMFTYKGKTFCVVCNEKEQEKNTDPVQSRDEKTKSDQNNDYSTKFRGDKKPSQNTVHDYIRVLKPFLFWLVENEIVVLPERKIKAIRAPGVDQDTKGPDDILTYEEVLKIIEGATSHRDKAFLMTLYESGGRVGEIASLKWKDVRFEDQKGVGLYIPNIKTKE